MIFSVDIAMNNSYNLIFNKLSIEDFKSSYSSYFMHNPENEVTDSILMDMFKHFKSKKEWKKVVKITTLRVKIKYYDKIKRLSRINSK